MTHEHLPERTWGPANSGDPRAGAHRREEPAPEAGRGRRQPQLRLHRTWRRLPTSQGREARHRRRSDRGRPASCRRSGLSFNNPRPRRSGKIAGPCSGRRRRRATPSLSAMSYPWPQHPGDRFTRETAMSHCRYCGHGAELVAPQSSPVRRNLPSGFGADG